MRITKEQLKQIIKEELENVLEEQNFDEDTGFPLNVAAMKKVLSNQQMLKRFEQYGDYPIKAMKDIVKHEKGLGEEKVQKMIRQLVQYIKNKEATKAAEKKLKDDKIRYEKELEQYKIDREKGMGNAFEELKQHQRKTMEDFYKLIDSVGGDDAFRSHLEKRTNGKFPYDEWKRNNIKLYTQSNPELEKWAMDNYERK